MRRAVRTVVATALGVSCLSGYLAGEAPGLKTDYDRAFGLRERVQDKIYNVPEVPTWIAKSSKCWYRKTVKGGTAFVLVDAAAATKGPAFDHARLASALSTAANGHYSAVTLPFTTFTFVDQMQAIEFTAGAGGPGEGRGRDGARGVPVQPPRRWHCTLTDYRCSPLAAGEAEGALQGRLRAAEREGAAGGQPEVRTSPDGKTEAFIQDFNLFVRPPDGAPSTRLSWDGSEGAAYTLDSIAWSPDSRKIAVYRHRSGFRRLVHYVQSSPADQLQPKLSSQLYLKPGDEVDVDMPAVFDLASKRAIRVDNTLFPNPYENGPLEWRKDSRAFTFEYNQRGHQLYRVIEVEATTGTARAVIEETSRTFIDYRRANAGLVDSGRQFRYDVADGREVIWMSERDGWSHLYLYDGVSGRVKQQITRGNWAVHFVEGVDESARQIWFTATGVDQGKDPYFLQAFRVNFDGSGLTRFTTIDAAHTVTWSHAHDYYVDTYSRVDLPPVSELHRGTDGSLVMELERADASDLVATGWKAPEVFVAKGRDGVSDVWGIIVRPLAFDPSRTYPVIENIYAGPQGSFVPKTFSPLVGMQTLAELGFVVVQIDGMGTANRSKAFHDAAWKNLGDAGLPDRIAWHRAVAARYPWYDVSRVGIYGTSAGGQNAMGAVLFHPEFYRAAVAASGCHDNRMDKIWWNEQWMGWPVGPEYAAASNVEHASELRGDLLLIYGEMDTNVDPSSTMQVVNRLVLANKNFELVALPNANHTSGGAYGDHKRFDFFVRTLRGLEPPAWTSFAPSTPKTPPSASVLDEASQPWVASEDWTLKD